MFQKFNQDTKTYLSEPVLKDSFKAVYEILKENGVLSVLDIGCAAGDFLNFLPTEIKGTGIDVSPLLIDEAKKRVRKKNIGFIEADILNPEQNFFENLKKKFDAVTILGTMHTFLDFEPVLERAIKIQPQFIYVHSPFNDAPIDTRHFHKKNDEIDYQCAYSIFSKETISRYLKSKSINNFRFIPFEMQSDLIKNNAEPLRNYHIKLGTGERFITNGIGIIFKEYILEIRLGN